MHISFGVHPLCCQPCKDAVVMSLGATHHRRAPKIKPKDPSVRLGSTDTNCVVLPSPADSLNSKYLMGEIEIFFILHNFTNNFITSLW